jgi:putative restriction endonuclease
VRAFWYDDQLNVHRQIFAGDEQLDYAFMGTDPSAPENVWRREAAPRQIPFIYFLGVSPGGARPSSQPLSWAGTVGCTCQSDC